ncbi:protein KRI1 homolog [Tribolium castaneum]|uniref:Protein KRI1 homolog n=1 Tax=Tribolium castaneum TaxID=7070 RepID=D6WTE2_TRICA|nr:PREDICTED: protein KRI1 homolog [Tribolium castaneum]EFA06706.1 Protein KRI1 homolog-like Protein [Tribolium castaneum]|eukprot:XP_973472.3 PREDICTED: protein KRI1 homolog [Tribolium castaneum]
MSKIFDNDSDSDPELKTDNEYAKNYDKWRKKEELNRLKTKYGEELLDEESSSSSSDDEEGVELTDEVEKQFFKTLSCLKNKDPRIYDENVRFFDETPINQPKTSKKSKKDKPLFVNDYERELILKKNGELSDDESGEGPPRSPTYIEEQNKLKESFKKALNRISESDDEDWGGVLKVRQKTEEEKKKEEADYFEWLAGQKEEIDDKEVANELEPLKNYWNKPDLDEGEKFLRDYILQKKFLSKEDEDYIPTYEEIVHDSDKDLSEDEEAIEKQEEFEHKYNFRFEEPDQEFIKRYPRTMEHSLRKTDDKRKVKRQETKERKKKEKEQKMQEMKKLQELKRREIEEKIQKLKEITGNNDMEFKDEDLEGDFDPEAHDKRMQNLFNDEFYQGPEGEQKPEFPELDELLEIENWEKWKGDDEPPGEETEYEPHCEDEDFNMDCDYDPKAATKQELIENSKGRKKRKRKSLFAKAVSQPKPVFDPNDKTYEQYLDEYYKFDCEDIIGDVPCRFKYRKVVPNSFGLSIEEILTASDRELNKWCSLKKAIQIRPDHVEKYDQIAFEKKGKNLELKKKILPSLFANENDKEENNEVENKKKKKVKKVRCAKTNDAAKINGDASTNIKKKKKKKKKIVQNNNETDSNNKQKLSNSETVVSNKSATKDKSDGNKKRKLSSGEAVPNKRVKKSKKQEVEITDARLSAYGINPKKFKNKLRYKKN